MPSCSCLGSPSSAAPCDAGSCPSLALEHPPGEEEEGRDEKVGV